MPNICCFKYSSKRPNERTRKGKNSGDVIECHTQNPEILYHNFIGHGKKRKSQLIERCNDLHYFWLRKKRFL